MCFSASASFGMSVLLLGAGVAAVKKAQNPSQIPFAVIPVVFSIQQFIEGALWLSLTNPAYSGWHQNATYIFLVFAQVVWPFWVPLSMLLLENDNKRKKIMILLSGLGCAVSLYLAFCLSNYAVNSGISDHHIRYDLDFPHYMTEFSGVFYFIPTVIPLFISSIKKMSFLGAIILASFMVTKLFFGEYVISIWCFFAAAASVIVLIIMTSFQTSPGKLNKVIL
ncbi:MAG: hypothetical protein JNL63_09965 [Bacteroidia bacterium]|nr:hypothetical protein [Bacteroidia bacterium]